MRISNFQFSLPAQAEIFKNNSKHAGFSLIETLVVVALFAIIGVVVSQSTAVSLSGSRKSDSSSKVRESLNYAMNVIERQLRSARSATCPTTSRVDYFDQDGNSTYFECLGGVNSRVASGSATINLTSPETVSIVNCEFVCVPSTVAGLPPTVNVVLEGESKETTGAENTPVRLETSVVLRAY